MPFIPSWERPVRLPESAPLPRAEPETAVAGEIGSWTLPFELRRDVPPDAELRLQVTGGRNNRGGFPDVQCEDPSAPGFVSAAGPDGAALSVSALDLGTEKLAKGTFRIDVPESGLRAGDRLTVVLGDTSRGSPGANPGGQILRNTFFLLYIFGGEEDGDTSLPAHQGNTWTSAHHDCIAGAVVMHVTGTDADHLFAYAPSRAVVGEPVEIALRPQDRFGNLASEAPGDVTVSVDGETIPCETEALDDTTAVRLRVTLPRPGVFRLLVRDGAHDIETRTNPILCTETPPESPARWGMIHGHTELSDGTGSLHNLLRQLRDECGYEFVAPGDHDHLYETTDDMWELSCRLVREFHEPGRFVTFPGYEFAKWRRKGEGDRNVYFRHDDRPIYRSDEGCYPWPNDLFAALRSNNEDAVVIPHHSGHAPAYCDWQDHDPEFERLVEIFQVRGSYECRPDEDNPLPERDYGEPPVPVGTIREALRTGWRVGFTAGGDDHGGTAGTERRKLEPGAYYNAGNFCVFAAENTRESVWNALRNRRTTATSGPRILLRYTLDGADQGAELQTSNRPALASSRTIAGSVHAEGPVERVDIVRCGAVAESIPGSGEDMEFTWTDETPIADILLPAAKWCPHPFAYYYVRCVQENGNMAWASPVWIDPAE